jgi:hypothetical protein
MRLLDNQYIMSTVVKKQKSDLTGRTQFQNIQTCAVEDVA